VTTYATLLAPKADRFALGVAAVGLVIAVLRRSRPAVMLAVLGGLAAGALVLDPQGKLYNTRFLPLWWLCVYLVAGYCLAELGVLVATWWRDVGPDLRAWWSGALWPAGGYPAGGGVSGAMVSGPFGGEAGSVGVAPPTPAGRVPEQGLPSPLPPPPGSPRPESPGGTGGGRPARRWRWAPGAVGVPLVSLGLVGALVLPPLLIGPTSHFDIGPLHITPNNVPGWAQWNYSGYEGKPGYRELHDGIVATMDKVTSRYGCGRAMWEYNEDLNRFGTPMALMLLPYFTDNCVDSMEGLLFESASSTPYHFLNQSELSAQPSDAMVGLQYGQPDVVLGVQHLQLMGVKYFLASSPSIEAQADADPALQLVATSGPWHTAYQGTEVVTTWKFYVVRDSAVVTPLSEQPAVLADVGPQQSSWLPVAQQWYLNPADWGRELTSGGPTDWPRLRAAQALGSAGAPLPPVRVSRVRTTTDTISFHVDRVGVPVVVRTSYFPAWHAAGATGPWRTEPNLMVVMPTAHDVTLSYGTTPAGWLGRALTAVGLVSLAVLVRRRDAYTIP
jgi:hypothetical protein